MEFRKQVKDIAQELGVRSRTIASWFWEGRGVPPKWQIKIVDYSRKNNMGLTHDDFRSM